MIIVNNNSIAPGHPIIRYLPKRIAKAFLSVRLEKIEEIRLRRGLPVMLYGDSVPLYVSERGMIQKSPIGALTVTGDDITEAIELISQSSMYAAEDSVRNGYITVGGGSRVGICGSAVLKNGSIYTIKNISGLNYRISREIYGVADLIMNSIFREGQVLNTLIISPPGCGKTTLLRDIVRQLSSKGLKISVADERNEISALTNGICGFDLGNSCDILEGAPKDEAMTVLIRSMAPQVIATDEIGSPQDISVIKRAIRSGVSVLSTIHSDSRQSLLKKHPDIADCFDCFITLSHRSGPGTVEEIYCGN